MLLSCFSTKNTIQKDDLTFYFYFDAKNENMFKSPKTFHEIKPLKYIYKLDNTDNVIFISKDKATWDKPKRTEIIPNDTIGLNIKYRKWLNKMTNDEKYSFFYKRSEKIYNIIEKDTLDGKLYLIKNVAFSEEIE